MATKTITVTEDSYKLLADNKLEDESFSEEINRILTKKNTKKLSDFFGILTKEEGDSMKDDLMKRREFNAKRMRDRIR